MGTQQDGEQEAKPSPLDDLPDDVLPADFVQAQRPAAPIGLEPDLSLKPQEAKALERGRRRLMGRRLHREVDQMREFLALGLETAIIRVPSVKAARTKRARFYFARKQQSILANEALLREADYALDLIAEVDKMYGLAFDIEGDGQGPFLRLRLEQDSGLEPG